MNSSIFTKGIVTIMMTSMLCVVYSSCSDSDDSSIVPEISVPAGSEDFFAKGLDFDSPAAEKKITFTTNVPWTISVSNTSGENDWLSVSPTNGDAINSTLLNNVTYGGVDLDGELEPSSRRANDWDDDEDEFEE